MGSRRYCCWRVGWCCRCSDRRGVVTLQLRLLARRGSGGGFFPRPTRSPGRFFFHVLVFFFFLLGGRFSRIGIVFLLATRPAGGGGRCTSGWLFGARVDGHAHAFLSGHSRRRRIRGHEFSGGREGGGLQKGRGSGLGGPLTAFDRGCGRGHRSWSQWGEGRPRKGTRKADSYSRDK